MTAFIMFAFNTDVKFVKYAEEKRQAVKDALKLAFYQRFYALKNKHKMTNMYLRLEYVHKMEVIMLF